MDDRTRQAFALWTQAQPAVSAFVHAMLADRSERDDVLQEVAIAVLESFDDYDATDVHDLLVQFALGAVAVGDGDDPACLVPLQLPSAVGSLQAERSFISSLQAERLVEVGNDEFQVLDGDSAAGPMRSWVASSTSSAATAVAATTITTTRRPSSCTSSWA